MVLGDLDQSLSRARLHVGGVDHGEQPAPQPLAHDVVQQVEGVDGGGLVVLVVADDGPAVVGGDHLAGREVLAGEVRLAGPGHADQHDQAHLREFQYLGHRVKTPIWVGAPTSGSSSPTGT
jgi:hypothetical protein